jgi:hypothetical protein
VVDRAFSITGKVVQQGAPESGIAAVQLGTFSLMAQQYGMAMELTDASGDFAIHGLRPATYILFAAGEGTVPEIGKSIEVVDRDVTGVVVELAVGATLSGQVEPAQAGVRIGLEKTGEIGFANMFDAFKGMTVRAETDDTGAFTLRHAPAGEFTVVARVPASGDSGTLPLAITAADQHGLVVKLETRASIRGRVVDGKGAAVAGAEIQAQAVDSPTQMFQLDTERSRVTAGPDGSFAVVGLDAGSYRMSVRADDEPYAWAGGKRAPTIDVTAGQQRTGVTLTVEARDGVIRGQVVGADRKPVADAWVSAQRETLDYSSFSKEQLADPEVQAKIKEAYDADEFAAAATRPVLTGADGRFQIARLRRGTYKVVAEGPRGASRGEVGKVKTGTNVTIMLASLGTLRGTVTLASAPVTDFALACYAPSTFEATSRSFKTKDGSYTLERLAPGTYTCTATAKSGSVESKIEVPAGSATHDFALAPWATLTGKVVDVLTKKPVQSVLVVATNMVSTQNLDALMQGRAPRSGQDGTFRITEVQAGEGTVNVMPPDGSFSQSLGTREFTATAGQTTDVGTIEIIKPRTGEAGTYGFATTVENAVLVVSSVRPDGPAAAAGLREGDRITALDGTPVATLGAEIAWRLVSSGSVGVGERVQLTVERGATIELISIKW